MLAGREGNTVLVESEDGFRFGRKQLLMRNEDYPDDLSCHVRDPKVWKQDGRVVMMAWMGMPDCPEYGNSPALAEGWQHCFTFPREIYTEDGAVRQRPVQELEMLKRKVKGAEGHLKAECPAAWETDITGIQAGRFRAVVGGGLVLTYTGSRFEMRFEGPAGEEISGGRRLRYQEMESPDSVKILGDASSVEVFVNEGEYVFTTRYYPGAYTLEVEADGAAVSLYAVE